jgi:AhpD family alkylhydroperoxidase
VDHPPGTGLTRVRVPLADLPPDVTARLSKLGGRPNNLYRALANQPALAQAWIEFAWALRLQSTTSRALRELIILRAAQVTGAEYEWHHHRRMAREAGVPDGKVEKLRAWKDSDAYEPAERAALAFTEAMLEGKVPDAVADELERHFAPEARIELALTAGFYAMVPRVLEALRVPIEEDC